MVTVLNPVLDSAEDGEGFLTGIAGTDGDAAFGCGYLFVSASMATFGKTTLVTVADPVLDSKEDGEGFLTGIQLGNDGAFRFAERGRMVMQPSGVGIGSCRRQW